MLEILPFCAVHRTGQLSPQRHDIRLMQRRYPQHILGMHGLGQVP